jgi:hypothetical protein
MEDLCIANKTKVFLEKGAYDYYTGSNAIMALPPVIFWWEKS